MLNRIALVASLMLVGCADYKAELNKEVDKIIKLGLDCKVYVEVPEARGGVVASAKLYDCVRRTEEFKPSARNR